MEVIDEKGNVIPKQSEESKRVLAGILGIILGSLGIHKFILGYTTQGIIMLAITVVTCGIGGALTSLIGLIEGIIYLTKSDEEFVYTYQTNKKEWF
ncbi:TM2 domain-containing protein [uncultured Lutibacter sp.]|uniref:TM2 domain-containing protein n=1 Tax=uncultured Lutibacter sp. TaxID=437739 RepID=UPI002610C1D1|nr:TM2 domain-containing protein [uncultured Lutibacter sp.]